MVDRKGRSLEVEVRIPVQVRIFLLKSEIVISEGKNFKFISTYKFDLKHNKVSNKHYTKKLNVIARTGAAPTLRRDLCRLLMKA